MADRTRLSVPKTCKVCGYEIRKMPIGAYLRAMEYLKDFPGEIIDHCFPDMSLKDIIDKLTVFDDEIFKQMLYALFSKGPFYIVSFVSLLTGIEEEKLLNDENIGLDGFIDIINAFIEVNSLGKFIRGGRELAIMLKKEKSEIIGCKS